VEHALGETLRLLEEWCKREGINFEEVRKDASSDESVAEFDRADAAARADPLHALATAYRRAAFEFVDALAVARLQRSWPAEVDDALDTIGWNAGMVGAKVHRALTGFAERGEFPHDDGVQSDWNGSAKVARLVVAESKEAWRVVMTAGSAAPDSPLLELIALLDRLDRGLADRFPLAMGFVRPGFDEPAATKVFET
jgi:hypothetical protein